MTKMEPIDPASTKTSLELNQIRLERVDERCTALQTRDDDKYTWSANTLSAMLYESKIPTIGQLTTNERGEYIAQDLEAIDLVIGSTEWHQSYGLPPMKGDFKNVSLRGEDLSFNQRATKAKEVFLQMPREVLNKLSDEMFTIFSENFTMENYPCPSTERNNPFAKLIRMQKLIVGLQTRTVSSEDEIDKLARKTTKQRPSDLDEVRQQELGLRVQTQLLEQARYQKPGSLEHYVADMWLREQLKSGSRFGDATQYAMIGALTALNKLHGGVKVGLTIELVNQAIRDAYLSVNKHPVGKICEKVDGTARALYTQARPDAEGGGQGQAQGSRRRWPKKQLTPEEVSALRQECASLKNQLGQAKAQLEVYKAQATGTSDKKPETANPTAGDKRKFDTVQAKKAKAKVSPQPVATAKAKGFKIATTGDPPSDSESEEQDESDDDERHVKSKSNYASARAFVARVAHDKIISTKPSQPLQKSLSSTTLRIRSEGPTTRNQRRLIDMAIDQCDAEDIAEKADQKVPDNVTSDEEQSEDDVPDLESIPSDDEGQVPFRPEPLTNFIRAPKTNIYDAYEITCTEFCDDTLWNVKETNQIVQLCQIRRGPIFPTSEFYEMWATTDGGAKTAFNRHEAIQIWEAFSKDRIVNNIRLILFMRKTGMFYCECDINPASCTHVVGMFTVQDANHTKFDLPPVSIWGPKRMAKAYRRHMAQNDGLSNERIFTAAVYTIWMQGLSNLSTDQVRMHQDALFWYSEHVMDSDINRRYRLMLRVDASFRRGDVTHMQAYIELGVIMRDFWTKKGAFRRADLSIAQIQLRHTIMHNLPENYHSHVPVAAEATSLDYYGDWPGQMERQIEESLVRAAQDEGPPDWVAGPEGNIVTVDDEVAIKIK